VSFGVSTHISVGERLDRDLLVDIAAHAFEAIEVFALASHFDYRNRAAIDALGEWLDDTRLQLHSFHAPIANVYTGGGWRDTITLGATDDAARKRAVAEMQAVIEVAAVLPYNILVVHCGVPAPYGSAAENNRASVAFRSDPRQPVRIHRARVRHRNGSNRRVES